MKKTPRLYLIIATVVCVAALVASVFAFINFMPNASTVQTTGLSSCLDPSYKASLMAAWVGNGHDADSRISAKQSLTDEMKTLATTGNTVTLYNMYAGLSQIVVMENECNSYDQNDVTLLSDISHILLLAGPTADNPDSVFPPTQDSGGNYVWLCQPISCPSGTNQETLLYSAQFVDLASQLARAIAQVPAGQRTSSMTNFTTLMSPVLISHYDKWLPNMNVAVPTQIGYDGDFSAFLRAKLGADYDQILAAIDDPSPTSAAKNAAQAKVNNIILTYQMDDKPMLVADGAINMLAANKIDSGLINLSDNSKSQMNTFVKNEANLMQKRAYYPSLKDFAGNPATGMDFDKGVWKYYPYSIYANYTGPYAADGTIPSGAAYNRSTNNGSVTDAGPSWDIIHASSRWTYFLVGLREYKDRYGLETTNDFPAKADIDKLANEVAYSAPLNTPAYIFNLSQPLFSDYVNGLQGWFNLTQVAPGNMSSYMLVGWGQLAKYGNASKIPGGVSSISGLNSIDNFNSLPDLLKLKLASLSMIKRAQANLSTPLVIGGSLTDRGFCDKYYISGVGCNPAFGNVVNAKLHADLLYLPAVNISAKAIPVSSPATSSSPTITKPVASTNKSIVASSSPKTSNTIKAPSTTISSSSTSSGQSIDQAELKSKWDKYTPNPALTVSLTAITPPSSTAAPVGAMTGVTFGGIVKPNATVSLYVFSTAIAKSTKADSKGAWQIAVSDSLEQGRHTAYVSATHDGITERPVSPTAFQLASAIGTPTPTVTTGPLAQIASSPITRNLVVVISLLIIFSASYGLFRVFDLRADSSKKKKDIVPK